MKLRTYIAEVFGSIKSAIREYSQVAAVVRAVDERVGNQGAHGKNRPKNPFRGIACSNGSSYPLNFFRHVEGARDTRPSFCTRRRGELLRSVFSGTISVTPFRDTNWHPAGFAE